MAINTRVYERLFPLAEGATEAHNKRVAEVNDIVERIGVISPKRVFINNYPISNPPAVFNPSIIIEGHNAYIYARIISGYYMYVSGIVEIPVPFEDIESGNVNLNHYAARLAIYPSTKYDLWGTEDPRVYVIDNDIYMTYTGRTINYFNPAIRVERTLPITAVRDKVEENKWYKKYVHKLPNKLSKQMISNKDAFIAKINGEKYFFHRPHMNDEHFYLLIGKETREIKRDGITEVIVENNIEVLRPLPEEDKLGWSTPPISIGKNKVIALLHAVDKEIKAYKLLAVELEFAKDGVIVTAVTPRYIMVPKESYEVFGDRPYTVFPCGVVRIGDELYITYGAADYMIGIGKIDLIALEGELDKGRVH